MLFLRLVGGWWSLGPLPYLQWTHIVLLGMWCTAWSVGIVIYPIHSLGSVLGQLVYSFWVQFYSLFCVAGRCLTGLSARVCCSVFRQFSEWSGRFNLSILPPLISPLTGWLYLRRLCWDLFYWWFVINLPRLLACLLIPIDRCVIFGPLSRGISFYSGSLCISVFNIAWSAPLAWHLAG